MFLKQEFNEGDADALTAADRKRQLKYGSFVHKYSHACRHSKRIVMEVNKLIVQFHLYSSYCLRHVDLVSLFSL